MPRASKKKIVLDRIQILEDAIAKAREYLETGAHADFDAFRPLFSDKLRDGKPLPPHKDWVKNVFLPGYGRALRRAEKLLERLERSAAEKSSSNQRRGSAREIEKTPLPTRHLRY